MPNPPSLQGHFPSSPTLAEEGDCWSLRPSPSPPNVKDRHRFFNFKNINFQKKTLKTKKINLAQVDKDVLLPT